MAREASRPRCGNGLERGKADFLLQSVVLRPPVRALRTRIADSAVHIEESLRDDAELRDKVDNWIIRAAQHLVVEYGAATLHHRDNRHNRVMGRRRGQSPRSKLHVGRDLQFIPDQRHGGGSLAGPTTPFDSPTTLLTCAN